MAQKKSTAKATKSGNAISAKSSMPKKVVKTTTKAKTMVAKAQPQSVTKTKVNAGTTKIAAPKLAAKRPTTAKAIKTR